MIILIEVPLFHGIVYKSSKNNNMNIPDNSLTINDVTYIALTIPILIMLAFVPYFLQVLFTYSYKKTWNNVNPTVLHSIIKDEAKGGNEYAQRIVRCRACHRNCWESLIVYSIAIVFVFLFFQNRTAILILVSFHFVARVLYIPAYIFIGQKYASLIRSVLFWFALLSALTLLFYVIIEHHVEFPDDN